MVMLRCSNSGVPKCRPPSIPFKKAVVGAGGVAGRARLVTLHSGTRANSNRAGTIPRMANCMQWNSEPHSRRRAGDGNRFPEPIAMVDYSGAGGGVNCSTGNPPTGCVYHYLRDVLGSVVGLTNASGQLIERYTYDPYGKTFVEKWTGTAWATTNASSVGNPFMWTGQRYDAATGTYHFLYRTYSPTIGRWLQRDPAGFMDGVNLYEYVASRPVASTDADGRKANVSVNSSSCTISVTVNIGIYGEKASHGMAAQVKSAIEGKWNGHDTKQGCTGDGEGCKVRVIANVKYYPNAKHWISVPEDNQIKFDGETNRSWVSSGLLRTWSYGHWDEQPRGGDGTFAHEAGHLMGLPDDYKDDPGTGYSVANPGHENHLMANSSKPVAQHEVDSILQGKKCPESCCKKEKDKKKGCDAKKK